MLYYVKGIISYYVKQYYSQGGYVQTIQVSVLLFGYICAHKKAVTKQEENLVEDHISDDQSYFISSLGEKE